MEGIDVRIKPVVVRVYEKEYDVAPKTIAVARELARISNDETKLNYQKWLAHMHLVLGSEAVAELFPEGDAEDLDRMENIYIGVMAAFDYNGRSLRAKREQEDVGQLKDLANTLTTIAERVREIHEKYPGIARS